MAKILVLGVDGMLGSMVYNYLSQKSQFQVKGTLRKKLALSQTDDFFIFDAAIDNLENIFSEFKPDYIINCIGIINKYIKDNEPDTVARAETVNVIFPKELAQAAQQVGARVIQIATDCVFSGVKGNYLESDQHDPIDAYGRTKSQGEVKADNFLNIRCSIIGPEVKNKASLLEWFLGQEDGSTIKGFSHHLWNGVTTLQFAELCADIISQGNDYFDSLVKTSAVHHYLPNQAVSKYELLNIFKQVFAKDVTIEKVDNIGPAINRSLATNLSMLTKQPGQIPMFEAVQALKDYLDKK